LELGIDNAIALAIVHYRNILGLDNLLIAFPYFLKIIATCHKSLFEFMAQR